MNFGSRKIEVSRLPEIDGFDESRIESALNTSFGKFEKLFGPGISLKVHFKQHETGGKRAKHSVHVKLFSAHKTLFSEEAGWVLADAVQKALKVLEREALKELGKN